MQKVTGIGVLYSTADLEPALVLALVEVDPAGGWVQVTATGRREGLICNQ